MLRARSLPFQLAVAMGSTLLALALSLRFPGIFQSTPFLLFFGAIVVSVWFGGLIPGLVSTALSVILTDYFLLPPLPNFEFTVADLVRLALFTGVALLINTLYVSRARGQEQVQGRLAIVERLSAFSASLIQHRPEAELYPLALAALDDLTGADASALLLFDSSGALNIASAHNLPTPLSAQLPSCPWPTDTRDAAPVSLPDLSASLSPHGAAVLAASPSPRPQPSLADPTLAAHAAAARDAGFRSLAIIPLLGESRLLGQFVLYYRTPHSLPAEQLQSARTVAAQLTLARQRNAADTALHTSESRYRLILQYASDAIAVSDPNGIVTEANQAYYDLYKLTPDQVIGRPFSIIFPPERRAEADAGYLRTFTSPQHADRIESLVMRGDGSIRTVEAAYTFVQENGVRTAMISLIHDITERRRSVQALQVSEERFRLALSSSAINVFNQDLDLHYTWLYRPRPGLPVEALGKTDAELMPPEDAVPLLALKREVLATNTSRRAQIRQRYDDADHYFELFLEPLYDVVGALSGLAGVEVEITDRVRAEQEREQLLRARDEAIALEHSARSVAEDAEARGALVGEFSRTLALSLDYFTTLHDITHRLVPRVADWCLIDLVDPEGVLQLAEILHPDTAAARAVHELFSIHRLPPGAPFGAPHVLRTGLPDFIPELTPEHLAVLAPTPAALDLLRRAGAHSLVVVPLPARASILGAITLVRANPAHPFTPADAELAAELARRAATAIDNARLYQHAQTAIRLRDEFLAVASHELKSPLTSMLGYSEMLNTRSARANFTEQDERSLRVMTEQTSRLSRMVDTLLDIARIEEGQLAIEHLPVDLNRLVSDLVAGLQPSFKRHTFELRLGGEPLIISGDALRLQQVFQNLIQNAVTYSPRGGSIALELVRADQSARFTLRDQGIGIPRTALARIFNRFYRASNTRPWQIQGMGIGLFIVREIITRHGGTISVESEEGSGTTFTILLPLSLLSAP